MKATTEQLHALFKNKKYVDVIDICEAALSHLPDTYALLELAGGAHAKLEQYEQAIRHLQKALIIRPDHYIAHSNLGLLHASRNMHALAIPHLQSALDLQPEHRPSRLQLIRCFSDSGQPDQAIECLGIALNLDETDPEFLQLRADILYEQGKFKQALSDYENCLTRHLDQGTIWNKLGRTYKEIGELSDAKKCFQKAVEHEPNCSITRANLAAVMSELGEEYDAIEVYEQALQREPASPETINSFADLLERVGLAEKAYRAINYSLRLAPHMSAVRVRLSTLLFKRGQVAAAIQNLQKVVETDVNNVPAWMNLGNIFEATGKLGEAVKCYEKVILLDRDSAKAHNNLAVALQKLGRFDMAKAHYSEAIALDPKYASAYKNMAILLQHEGDIAKSISFHEKALEYDPYMAISFYALSRVPTYEPDSSFISRMEQALQKSKQAVKNKSRLHFALARAYANAGNFQRSLEYLEAGNELKNLNSKYNLQSERDFAIDLMQKSAEWLSYQINYTPQGCAPIFIVGMPRSGSTLTEQIISAHSSVAGMGEIQFCLQCVRGMQLEDGDKHKQLLKLRTEYFSKFGQLAANQRYFTDKMPLNFLILPILASSFPEAKFIHTFREAKSTCWSNFETFFEDAGMDFTNDMVDLVCFYQLYKEAMDAYSDALKGRMYHLKYESLVATPEQEISNMAKFLNLDLQDAMLSPHLNQRPVLTASSEQVRSPIQKPNQNRWKTYEPFFSDRLACILTLESFNPV